VLAIQSGLWQGSPHADFLLARGFQSSSGGEAADDA
jgi:hypothetical protein